MIEPLPKLRSICASAEFERLLLVQGAFVGHVEKARGCHAFYPLFHSPFWAAIRRLFIAMFAYLREQDKNIPQVFPGITSALVG